MPVRRADIAVFFRELERVKCPENLVDISSERKIVDRRMAHNAELVDDEQSAQRHGIVIQHLVVAGDRFRDVRNHRELHIADAPFLRFRGFPGKMGIFRVNGNGNDFAVPLFEFVQFPVERNDFRRADKCEVHRIEEQHNVFSPVLRKGERGDAEIRVNGIRGEIRRFSGD